jgi:hypothetical protein
MPRRSVRARELHKSARVDAGAAATAQRAAERTTAAEQVRRPRLGVAEHQDENERHLRVPHLAAKLRATSSMTARQRTERLPAAARLGLGGGAVQGAG